MKASGSGLQQLLGARDGEAHALRGGRQLQLGAEQLQHPAALHRHAVGHDEDAAIALGRGDEGERDAGIARGRLDQHGLAGRELPAFSAASIMATPMRSLTELSGLKNSHLPSRSALTPCAAASRFSRTSGVAPTVSTMLS